MSTPAAEKRFCKYHYKCAKQGDADHQQQFVCVYLKPCRDGPSCAKKGTAEHDKFFSHLSQAVELAPPQAPRVLQRFASAPRVLRPQRVQRQQAPLPERAAQRPRTVLNETNSKECSVSFIVQAVSDRLTFAVQGSMKTRVHKALPEDKVREQLTRTISRRYCGRQTYTSSNIVLSDLKVEEQAAVAAPATLPTHDELEQRVAV